jgi:formate dehydrogenase major subunit
VYATESIKDITYSMDPRDFGQVRKSVPCQNACPAHTNIPGYIRCIHEKRYGRSYELNRMANILPGVLGRICSRPCELFCRHGESDLGSPVSICSLKRSAADLKSPMHRIMEGLYSPSGRKVAVIGAGPAGLGAAHELAVLGHKVVIYEAFDKPGGMLMYGIPEFRLPRDVLQLEIENIIRLGVELKTGVKVGTDVALDELLEQYDAVVTATGCTKPNNLGVEGEGLENVYSGVHFMEMINNGEKPYVGKNVMVIGDGFTAMDCSRSAVRLGASEVKVNIRKTEEYMPIDEQEKFEVKFEKIRFYSLVDTKRIIGENGRVTGIEFLRTKLEYSPEPPYRMAVPIPNSEFILPADSVIVAIGQRPDPASISSRIPVSGSLIGTEEGSYRTSVNGLYAAGDCSSGASNVITAIANGRKCALEVDEYLTGRKRKVSVVRLEAVSSTDRERSFDFIRRTHMDTLGIDDRMASQTNEVEKGYSADQAAQESKRCYLCNLKYEIDTTRCIYCSACIDVAPRDCIKMIHDVSVNDDGSLGNYNETRSWNRVSAIAIDNERCIRCGKCHEVCPMNCISVTKTELIELNIEE